MNNIERIVSSVILVIFLLCFSCLIYYIDISYMEKPAKCLKESQVFEGYVIEAIVSDTQLYATLPNDDTVYLLTLSSDKYSETSIFNRVFKPYSDYITIVDIQIPNGDKSEQDLHK